MEILEFIKKTLPELIEENEWEEYEYKEPEYYIKFLSEITVYKMTYEQKQDFINTGYDDYVENVKIGEWVLDDGEVCYTIDRLSDLEIEMDSSYKEGYRPRVEDYLRIRYAYFLQDQQCSDCC